MRGSESGTPGCDSERSEPGDGRAQRGPLGVAGEAGQRAQRARMSAAQRLPSDPQGHHLAKASPNHPGGRWSPDRSSAIVRLPPGTCWEPSGLTTARTWRSTSRGWRPGSNRHGDCAASNAVAPMTNLGSLGTLSDSTRCGDPTTGLRQNPGPTRRPEMPRRPPCQRGGRRRPERVPQIDGWSTRSRSCTGRGADPGLPRGARASAPEPQPCGSAQRGTLCLPRPLPDLSADVQCAPGDRLANGRQGEERP